jgi:hypothetical protein
VSSNNVHWYKGWESDPNGPVLLKTQSLNAGPLNTTDGAVAIANLLVSGAYSFSGQFDEFRIFGSKDDNSGVLSLTELTAVFDHGLETFCGDENHPYPPGDINLDCIVNLEDFALMMNDWMKDTRK